MPQNPVSPASNRPPPTNSGTAKNHGETSQSEQRPQKRQAAGADLHLALQLDRLPAVDHGGQSGLAPALQPALEHEGLAALVDLGGERGGIAARAGAGAAVEDHGAPLIGREVRLVELREREMADAGDALARMLVAFPDVHQDRSVVDETLGLVRADGA